MNSAMPVYIAISLALTAWSQSLPQNVKSPEISSDGRVTFRLWTPEAQKVSLFMLTGPAGSALAMTKDSQGVWSVTTGPMEPDYYNYVFIVDGAFVPDPANPIVETRAAECCQSLAHVPGPPSLSWELNNVAHGNIVHQFYHSDLIGDDRDFYVYTPPMYDPAAKTEYPVLYLLHGAAQGTSAWTAAGRANVILDNLIARGIARPMIIVNPLGFGIPNPANGFDAVTANLKDRTKLFNAFATSLLNEVVPIVEKTYRVARNRDARAIAGLSSGGAQAFFIGLNHIDKFAYIAGFSSALLTYRGAHNTLSNPDRTSAESGGKSSSKSSADNALSNPSGVGQPLNLAIFDDVFSSLDAKFASQIRLLWISCGTEDPLIGNSRQFRDWLQAKNIQSKYLETPGAHTWMVWRRNLTELAPLLFQTKK